MRLDKPVSPCAFVGMREEKRNPGKAALFRFCQKSGFLTDLRWFLSSLEMGQHDKTADLFQRFFHDYGKLEIRFSGFLKKALSGRGPGRTGRVEELCSRVVILPGRERETSLREMRRRRLVVRP